MLPEASIAGGFEQHALLIVSALLVVSDLETRLLEQDSVSRVLAATSRHLLVYLVTTVAEVVVTNPLGWCRHGLCHVYHLPSGAYAPWAPQRSLRCGPGSSLHLCVPRDAQAAYAAALLIGICFWFACELFPKDSYVKRVQLFFRHVFKLDKLAIYLYTDNFIVSHSPPPCGDPAGRSADAE